MVIKMTTVPLGPNSIQIAQAINFSKVLWAKSVGEVAGIWWLYYLNDAVNYYFEEEREHSFFKLPWVEIKGIIYCRRH